MNKLCLVSNRCTQYAACPNCDALDLYSIYIYSCIQINTVANLCIVIYSCTQTAVYPNCSVPVLHLIHFSKAFRCKHTFFFQQQYSNVSLFVPKLSCTRIAMFHIYIPFESSESITIACRNCDVARF